MLSIFSCASWPSVCLLWRNATRPHFVALPFTALCRHWVFHKPVYGSTVSSKSPGAICPTSFVTSCLCVISDNFHNASRILLVIRFGAVISDNRWSLIVLLLQLFWGGMSHGDVRQRTYSMNVVCVLTAPLTSCFPNSFPFLRLPCSRRHNIDRGPISNPT